MLEHARMSTNIYTGTHKNTSSLTHKNACIPYLYTHTYSTKYVWIYTHTNTHMHSHTAGLWYTWVTAELD